MISEDVGNERYIYIYMYIYISLRRSQLITISRAQIPDTKELSKSSPSYQLGAMLAAGLVRHWAC